MAYRFTPRRRAALAKARRKTRKSARKNRTPGQKYYRVPADSKRRKPIRRGPLKGVRRSNRQARAAIISSRKANAKRFDALPVTRQQAAIKHTRRANVGLVTGAVVGGPVGILGGVAYHSHQTAKAEEAIYGTRKRPGKRIRR